MNVHSLSNASFVGEEEGLFSVKGDHHQIHSFFPSCAPLLLVPKLHLGTELVFEALLRSAQQMIIIPRQCNCRDKCVPKCNLGTRNNAGASVRGRILRTSQNKQL